MGPSQFFLRGDGLLVLWGGVDSQTVDEEAMSDWWTNEHLPERLAIPGFLRARRYYAPDSESPTLSIYLTLYEVSSLATLTSKEYLAALNGPTLGTSKWMPTLASMNRSACKVIHSVARKDFTSSQGGGVGSTIAHISFVPPSSSADAQALQSFITGTLSSSVLAHLTTLAFHLVEQDDASTRSGSSSKSYQAVSFGKGDATATAGRWIVLVEFAALLRAPFSRTKAIVPDIVGQLKGKKKVEEVEVHVYELVCALSE